MAVTLDLVQMERLRKDGDEAVFKIIYEHLKVPIYVFCCRLVWDKEYAKDMVAETFLKLWNTRDKIKNLHHLTPLAYRIARNTCIDFLRTSGRELPSSQFIEKYSELFGSESNPSWMSVDADFTNLQGLIDRTKKEIREMPNEYGKVLRLFVLEHRKPAAIANMLGISVHTVKTHLVVGRRQLRQRLQDLGFPPNLIEKSMFSYFISQLHRNNI